MAAKRNTPVVPSNIVKIGNLVIETSKVIEVSGKQVTLDFYCLPLEAKVSDLVAALQSIDPPLSPEVFTQKLQSILHNARYVVLTLPDEFKDLQFRVQNKYFTLPRFSVAWELYQKVRQCNPMDRSREGNTNQVVFEGQGITSVGSFATLLMGIPQQRVNAANGGISGGYSPRVIFEALGKAEGYKARITSLSIQYDKSKALFAQKEAQEAAKSAAQKPAKKAKK